MKASVNAVAAALLVTMWGTPPTAGAVTPPEVDNGLLPTAASPAPLQPSVQHQPCAAPPVATAPGSESYRLDLASAHAVSRGEGQRVAVVDTGVTRHHRLADVHAGGDYVATGDGTQDCDGHGTLVAGIIAATPDLADTAGFVGIAPAAAILAIRQSSTTFSPDSSPHGGSGDVRSMAMAVRTAADLGATVINISTVACAAGPLDDGALGAALAYAVDVKDVVVVAAAGNVGGLGRCPRPPEGSENTWETATVVASPGWYDDYVLTVGSVGRTGAPSDFSLPGPWVDIAAPGEHVVSLHPGGSGVVDTAPAFGRATPISGTSYAAPVVSGVAALVRSRFPDLTARQVMQRIEATARPGGAGWTPLSGHGVVDPVAALSSEAMTVPQPTHSPAPVSVSTAPHTAPPPDRRASTTALAGAGTCVGLLAVAWAYGRSRRSGEHTVVGGERR